VGLNAFVDLIDVINWMFSDRDPARWNMEPKIVERRRSLFWEIFAADHFQVR
jgi:hypothetical protein